MTDLLTKCIKIAITKSTAKNLKKELLCPLPGMHMNTSEYLKSFYFILVKRTTSWQIAVFVDIYIDFVTLLKNIILQEIFYPGYFVIYFKDFSSNHHILKESVF